MKNIRLKKQEHRRLEAGHLWVFSNEIDVVQTPLKNFTAGELVFIEAQHGKALGIGYINPQALLCVRLLTMDCTETIDADFFIRRINSALALRSRFYQQNFYRLVFAESDLLPGLVIDRYNDIFVIQLNTAGLENLKTYIIAAIEHIFKPKAIFMRNDTSARALEGLNTDNEIVVGEIPEFIQVPENNCHFELNLLQSQKTGWYFDQAYNRKHLINYVVEQRVLDVYSYIGSWGITAAKNGAKEVYCIDSSANAMETVRRNAKLNQVENIVKTQQGDAIELMRQLVAQNKKFDVVCIDPPAFIKKRKDIPKGTQAYLKLNELALGLLEPNGILISSSCSMHLQRDDLIAVVQKAAQKQNVYLQILEHGFQAVDHPIHAAIPETEYLKTLFCRVLGR